MQDSAAGDFDRPKRSHKVLPVSVEVKVLSKMYYLTLSQQ